MEHTDDYGGDVRQSIEGGADADGSDNDEGSESIDDDDDDGDSIDVVTQDSKDVLVERLTDLLQRLTESTGDDTGGSKRRSLTRYDAAEISALHAKVDEMEHVLASRSASASSAATGGASAGSKRSRRRTRRPAVASDPFWAATVTTPPWLRTRFASEMSSGASSGVQPHVMSPVVVEDKHGEKHGDGADETTNREPEYVAGTVDALGLRTAPKPLATPSTEVSQLVRDAESLCAELSALVASLNARREESDARDLPRAYRMRLKALTCADSIYTTYSLREQSLLLSG